MPVDMICAKCQSEIKTFFQVRREIEVVLLYPPPTRYARCIRNRIARIIACEFSVFIIIGGDHLGQCPHAGHGSSQIEIRTHDPVCIHGKVKRTAVYVSKIGHLPRLRDSTINSQIVQPRKSTAEQGMEILLFVIIKSHVEKTDSLSSDRNGIDEAGLVERCNRRITTGKRAGIRMTHNTSRQRHVAATKKADTRRIGAHHGHVGSQSAQCPPHTDETRRTIQIFTAQVANPVNVLCDHRPRLPSQQKGTGDKKYITSHSFFF